MTSLEGTLQHHTVSANGLRQHYVEAGSGPPVILLRGFPETWYAWREQIPVLAERYRVIVPTCAGHLPHEERPDEVNEALLRFLDGWTGGRS